MPSSKTQTIIIPCPALLDSLVQLIESDGKDIKVFLSEVQAAWDKMWQQVYSADAAGW